MIISKFESSELSIRLAYRMVKMDTTWELFTNHFFRIFTGKVRYLSGQTSNGKIRSVITIARKFLYHLVILASAFLLTRDDLTHNWRLDWRDTNMEVNEFSKHFMEYIVLFLIMNI